MMTLKDALNYLITAEKYGVNIPDVDEMREKDIIKLAQEMIDKSDSAAESYMESHHEGHLIGECFECRDGI